MSPERVEREIGLPIGGCQVLVTGLFQLPNDLAPPIEDGNLLRDPLPRDRPLGLPEPIELIIRVRGHHDFVGTPALRDDPRVSDHVVLEPRLRRNQRSRPVRVRPDNSNRGRS